MPDQSACTRFASPGERRIISRENLGFYNELVIGGLYEFRDGTDVKSVHTYAQSLKSCIDQYPFLTVLIRDTHTDKAYYEGVLVMNIEDHVDILDEAANPNATTAIEQVLPSILDKPFSQSIPPWRIVVLPLPKEKGAALTHCFVVFAFSHGLGDGMAGPAFHQTFLNAMQHLSKENPSLLLEPSPTRTLPPPFDTPTRLPISWAFLLGPYLAVYFPEWLSSLLGLRAAASTLNAGTWTGAPVFYDPANTHTRIKLIDIPAPQLRAALAECRAHDTTLTGLLHQLLVRALSAAVPDPDITNFVSQTAVNMRRAVDAPPHDWNMYVSGYYEVHPRVPAGQGITPAAWEASQRTARGLAECAVRLQDQAIGLLRYLPSIRGWMSGKIGGLRDSSYEVSNIGAFDGVAVGARCRISKMVFAQPTNVPSSPLVFSVVSVKGGSLVCSVTWQLGALGVGVDKEEKMVEGVCESLKGYFEGLGACA